jgi:hypothetical protein
LWEPSPAVLLGQLDPVALDLVDSSDVDPVGADYFHVFFDFGHFTSSKWKHITRQHRFRFVVN